ncbi:MAG: hypothetical protein GY845_36615 [Planctomycetes bacterium]|nr:hypothetical protein [Planctomycetota bacterium]
MTEQSNRHIYGKINQQSNRNTTQDKTLQNCLLLGFWLQRALFDDIIDCVNLGFCYALFVLHLVSCKEFNNYIFWI